MLQRNIHIDFSKSSGKMKPILSLNSGPLATPSLACDLSESYRELGVGFVRTHGHPSDRVIDIHTVFRILTLMSVFHHPSILAPPTPTSAPSRTRVPPFSFASVKALSPMR